MAWHPLHNVFAQNITNRIGILPILKHNNPKGYDVNHRSYCPQADAGAELKRLEKWLAKTEEKLDGGKIVVSVVIPLFLAFGRVDFLIGRVFSCIESNLRPRRSSMGVILQFITHCPNGQQDICSRYCIHKKLALDIFFFRSETRQHSGRVPGSLQGEGTESSV